MRRLFPVTDETAAQAREWSLAELAAAYAYPRPPAGAPRPWLRANMVSTLDGAAQHEGHSQPISSAADMRVFGTLRALADVVVVGAETVRQEGYRPAPAASSASSSRSTTRAPGTTP
ncbi:dihydrofolate reductase family protein, partial [Streptomyces sp. NPDC004599]